MDAGAVQVLNGRLYYSPNCCRTVREPAQGTPEENPFIPPPQISKAPGLRNTMDLDIGDYLEPRWWTRPWGWISFFPHEPDFLHPPFHMLSDIPHRLHRSPDGSRYTMPRSLAASWEQLDRDLSFVTHLLQLHYRAPALRPMNPRGFGYSKSRSHPDAVTRSIVKARDWFSVWFALLSYLIAYAETVEGDLEPYLFLAKKHWATYLLEQGVERTFLDGLLTSFVFCFSPKIVRSGVFLHVPPKDGLQPPAEWFSSYDIPVWYPWGEQQAKDSRFSSLAPPTHLLQLGTTTISKSPSKRVSNNLGTAASTSTDGIEAADGGEVAGDVEATGNVEAADGVDEAGGVEEASPNLERQSTPQIPAEQSAPPQVVKQTSRERFFEAWCRFHESRQTLNQRMEQTETTLEKQKRLARERQPPTVSAKVFRWAKDDVGDGYIREQVSKKWRQDTLGGYSSKQIRYDAFANEWDCSSEFGSDDESESVGEEADDEDDFVDYDCAEKECSAVPLVPTPKQSVELPDNEQWLPFASQPESSQSQRASSSYLDIYEEEIIETARIYFGYSLPLPAPPMASLRETSRQKKFLRILGLSWNESSPALFSRPRILALCDFIEKLASQASISSDEWDLAKGNRAYVAFTARFQLFEEVQGPDGPLFMLDLHKHATVKWKLTLTTAAHALLVCRLHPRFQETDIAVYLLRRGIPFHTLQDSETLPKKRHRDLNPFEHPYRPHGYNFDIKDYAAYIERCRYVILHRSIGRAVLLRGGYLWRIAVSEVSFEKVLSGPSGLSHEPDEMIAVTLPNGKQYVDDSLKDWEIMLLTGVYNCGTAHPNQIALKSWCPSPRVYARSGLDYGRWTSCNEMLYEIGSYNAEDLNAKVDREPCPANQWRNICRGSRDLSRAMFKLEDVSLSLIRSR